MLRTVRFADQLTGSPRSDGHTCGAAVWAKIWSEAREQSRVTGQVMAGSWLAICGEIRQAERSEAFRKKGTAGYAQHGCHRANDTLRH